MDNYICKIASIKEMQEKWDYEISNALNDKSNWIKWKKENMDNYENGYIIPYYGILNGTIICEATAHLGAKTVQNSNNLVDDNCVYLSAFRTNKEYQGKGYGTGLISFARDYTKTIDCYEMFLITNRSNISACKCYEKAGGINDADDEVVYVYDFREED